MPHLSELRPVSVSQMSMPQKRPFGVTLFLWMVLSLTAWGSVRLTTALRWWDALREFGARLDPLYLSITGAGWSVAGLALLWSIWRGKAWARWAIFGAISMWLAEYWIERLFFQTARSNWPFALFISILLLSITSISTLHKSTKLFFVQSEEYEQQNEHPTSAGA